LSVVSSRSNFERIQQKFNTKNEMKHSPKKLNLPKVIVNENSTISDIINQLDTRLKTAGELPVISKWYVLEQRIISC